MPGSENIVRGAVKIDKLPDDVFFKDFEDFIRRFPEFLVVEIPTTITNVIVSNQQPNDANRDSVWFRRSNSGAFLGIYVYGQGKWSQIFPTPQQVFWMTGNSTDVPAGYTLIEQGHPTIPQFTIDFIVAQYQRDVGDSFFTYFASTFTGL